MPKVTINDRTVEVEPGTNLVEAAAKVGVQIPHYCYHPRLSVVGQCRMCMVEVEMNGRKMPKLQAGCSTPVADGMVVRTDTPEVHEAQKGMMEFLLINHPLDCPICDQAGECGLQDYSFKHGVAYSRFEFEDKRTYPGRERIPLGANVLLNMNRCIQCTRCVRFTQEIAGTSEIGFFNRGSHAEIGVFPGKELSNPLATCVVDVCPVGALTSTRFRFAERVFNLDKKPSICAGCDAGCNITIEHRRGKIRRYKPRTNPEVNDYWMCDDGRASWEKYRDRPRLTSPRVRGKATTWKEALDAVYARVRSRSAEGATAILGSGQLTTEEAYLFAQLADQIGTPHRSVAVDPFPERRIPNPQGGVVGNEAAPNRRGAELAGLAARPGAFTANELIAGDAASRCATVIVGDGDFGAAAWDEAAVARLREASFLIVFSWADSPLAQAADVALPIATHAEKDGSFVNSQRRVQRFRAAFPAPGQVRGGVEVLSDLLARFDPAWGGLSPAAVFDRFAGEAPELSGLEFGMLPPTGSALAGNAPDVSTAAGAEG
ncbi:MAG TPA: 2Fe-2S iron-sulfur cluster-binding protein [Thermoanaerobaculia bacterium]|jgi:NADH-quinone oxidoreductase subunit G|nr:2Fe-2S iron-sulfur cluster-binding protein [Thermoanaerobaculia bacterium]